MFTKTFILLILINTVLGTLFHESSLIQIEPPEDIENVAFGFSIGYQKSGQLGK